MPRYYRRRRRMRRYPYRRRAGRVSRFRGTYQLADKFMTKLRDVSGQLTQLADYAVTNRMWNQVIDAQGGVPVASIWNIRGNSLCYRTNIQVTRVNCTGMARYADLYKRYIVRGSKLTMIVRNYSHVDVRIGLMPTPNAIGKQIVASNNWTEQQGVKWMLLKGTGGTGAETTPGTSVDVPTRKLSMYMSTRKMYPENYMMTDTTFQGTCSFDGTKATYTDPTLMWYWNIIVSAGTDPAALVSTTKYWLKVDFRWTYYVTYMDRVEEQAGVGPAQDFCPDETQLATTEPQENGFPYESLLGEETCIPE